MPAENSDSINIGYNRKKNDGIELFGNQSVVFEDFDVGYELLDQTSLSFDFTYFIEKQSFLSCAICLRFNTPNLVNTIADIEEGTIQANRWCFRLQAAGSNPDLVKDLSGVEAQVNEKSTYNIRGLGRMLTGGDDTKLKGLKIKVNGNSFTVSTNTNINAAKIDGLIKGK